MQSKIFIDLETGQFVSTKTKFHNIKCEQTKQQKGEYKMKNQEWTTFYDENGREFFLNSETGEVDEGIVVHLHLRTGSKYKIISPEKQQKFKDRQQKYLKRINQQKFYVAYTKSLAGFLLTNNQELVNVYRDSFCQKKNYLFRDSAELQHLISEYFSQIKNKKE